MKYINRRLKRFDHKGLTLVELIITVAISTLIVGAIMSVILALNNQTKGQYQGALARNEVRSAALSLTNDIRYAQDINNVTAKELVLTDKAGKTVRYYLASNGGVRCLARQSDSLLLFKEIRDVNFSLENRNLVAFDLITADDSASNFKVSKLDLLLNQPGDNGGRVNIDEIFIYSNRYVFEGNRVESPDGSIFINGDLKTSDLNQGNFSNVKNIYINGTVDINGGSSGMGLTTKETGNIYISGDFLLRNGTRHIMANVYVGGNAYIKDAIIYGDMYINGDLELNWTPTFYGKVYYTGSLKGPTELLKRPEIKNNCIKVDNVDPFTLEFDMPQFRPDSWYQQKGYQSGTVPLANNIKIYTKGNYSFKLNWTYGEGVENIVIVSHGNISLDGEWHKVSGVLFAPNGQVSLGNLKEFEGVIISRDGVFYKQGGTILRYKRLSEFFGSKENYPFE